MSQAMRGRRTGGGGWKPAAPGCINPAFRAGGGRRISGAGGPRRGSLVRIVVFGGWALAAAVLLGTAASHALGVTLSWSDSMPRGAWIAKDADPRRVRPGDVVSFCPGPGQTLRGDRGGNCAGGARPVLKTVAAVAGDRVELGGTGVAVNGVMVPNSAPLAFSAAGLTRVKEGEHAVGGGQVWLMSEHSVRSLDSRYYGPVAIEQVQAVMRPLLLLGPSETGAIEDFR